MDARSLINLLSPTVQESIFKAHKTNPELFGLSEEELLAHMGERGAGPTTNALRMKFWFEYDEAQSERRAMKVNKVTVGICDITFFYKTLQDPLKVAWILTRPTSYEDAVSEMHQFALSRLRKTLEVDPFRNGKFDSKTADIQLKIFQTLDTRVKGAVVQKTMNVHASVPAAKSQEESTADIERRLKELERAKTHQIIDARVVETK